MDGSPLDTVYLLAGFWLVYKLKYRERGDKIVPIERRGRVSCTVPGKLKHQDRRGNRENTLFGLYGRVTDELLTQ